MRLQGCWLAVLLAVLCVAGRPAAGLQVRVTMFVGGGAEDGTADPVVLEMYGTQVGVPLHAVTVADHAERMAELTYQFEVTDELW